MLTRLLNNRFVHNQVQLEKLGNTLLENLEQKMFIFPLPFGAKMLLVEGTVREYIFSSYKAQFSNGGSDTDEESRSK